MPNKAEIQQRIQTYQTKINSLNTKKNEINNNTTDKKEGFISTIDNKINKLTDIISELIKTQKPEELASMPPTIQYEKVCCSHAFARSMLRTLRVLGLVSAEYNEKFYYALFIFALMQDKQPVLCFKNFIDSIINPNYNGKTIFTVSRKTIKEIKFPENDPMDINKVLVNVPETYGENIILDGFDPTTFIESFTELIKSNKIYLFRQQYRYIQDERNTFENPDYVPTPPNYISTEIKDALQKHLQPTVSTNEHAMVLRGWGGTAEDINTVYIKNTWESLPLIVLNDIGKLDQLVKKDAKQNITIDTVWFHCLTISDEYFKEMSKTGGEDLPKYKDTYVCDSGDKDVCTKVAPIAKDNNSIGVTTHYYHSDKNVWSSNVPVTNVTPLTNK